QGATTNVVANYTVTDEHGASSSSTLTITLTGTNDAPVAVADTNSGNEETTTTGPSASNDSDVDDGADLTYSLNAPVAGLTLNTTGSYSFAPSLHDALPISQGATTNVVANYTVTDNHGGSSSSTLTITLTGTNDAPVAVADTNAGDPVTEAGVNPANTPFPGDATAAGNVLTNDTDVDTGDTKTVSAVNGSAANVGTAVVGTYGSVTIASDGSYSYTLDNADPDTNALAQGATATDQFSYTVVDSNGATSSTTLTITLTGTNDAPVAVADTNAGDPVTEAGVNPANTPFPGDATAAGNVLTNDTDVDTGDTKTVSAVNGSAANVGTAVVGTYGSVTIASDGSYSYTLDNADPDTNALAQG